MLAKRILNVWKNYITSQFLVTLFIFILTWLMGWLTGLHYPLINALVAAVCEAIPNFGPLISGAISAILAVSLGSTKMDLPNWQFALVIIGGCILIQLLQNWLISPMIIGKKMDLNPIVIFVGMLIFSALFGFWGMILAVPVMASFKEALKYTQEQKPPDPDRLESPQKEKTQIEKPQQ
ncbi:MAG: AI-2E family transporter [Anaerolineaceae bacterium]|nr:AI-2E family transporter [Anaerolineaceae bacterium]